MFFPSKLDSSSDSFSNLDEDEVETHSHILRYGDFQLTGAVVPAYDLKVKPIQGYSTHFGSEDTIMTIVASAEILFELFLELTACLGEMVDVSFCYSHEIVEELCDPEDLVFDVFGHPIVTHLREDLDNCVFRSKLIDFKTIILEDGFVGVKVTDLEGQNVVEMDEHKFIFVETRNLSLFEAVLQKFRLRYYSEIPLIWEAEHLHLSETSSSDVYFEMLISFGAEEEGG